MRLLRSVFLGAAVAVAGLAPAVVPAATGATAACAAVADGPHAGLVVDTGGHATSYCVALDASTVSGIHLIELAGQQYGLQYRLGFGGQAVCQLAGVGPDGDDCFADYPSFWGYWHGSGDDGWSWASTGAASATISSGDRDGWSWGTGDSGSSHAPPPGMRLTDICADSSPTPPPPSPSPSPPSGGGGGSGHGGGSGGTNPGSKGDAGTGSHARKTTPSAHPSRSPARAGARASPRVSGNPTPLARGSSGTGTTHAAAGATRGGSGGAPPAGAALAVAAVIVLVAAGARKLRNRTAHSR